VGFTADPVNGRRIDNGTMDVIVEILHIPIAHKIDICIKEDGWPGCPFDGSINITDLNPANPRFSPSGPFKGTFNVTDDNGAVLMCLQTEWKQV
jgi:hypothetical protein